MNDIKNEPIFHPGKRHYVLCGDEEGFQNLNSIKERLTNEKKSFEEIHLSRECLSEVDRRLGLQKMGAYLYVAAEENKLKKVITTASRLGYSSEEAQFIRVGKGELRIFCCRCHVISRVNNSVNIGEHVNCNACRLKLELTDHYSPIKDAYLGHVSLI